MPRPRMTLARPSALLTALVALPLVVAGCTQGSSASDPTSSAAQSSDEDGPRENLRTGKGGGTITLTGDYSADMTFDSVYCIVANGTFVGWRAPVVLDENGDLAAPEGVDWAEGTVTGLSVMDAEGASGTAPEADIAVDGETITFHEIPLTMMVGDVLQDTVATGDLTCSTTSEFTG